MRAVAGVEAAGAWIPALIPYPAVPLFPLYVFMAWWEEIL